jgi:DNA gyrase/topoisomerase IV subunit B
MELSGQFKDKLILKKESLDKFISILDKELQSYFQSNADEYQKIATFFEEYRMAQDSKNHKAVSSKKRASVQLTKLRDCLNPGGELFCCEGDSASGSIIDARDKHKHAVLSFRGKIKFSKNHKSLLENKEISEFIQAIGTGYGPNFDITKLRYDKIICATDADADGKHIAAMFTMVTAFLVPEIIKQGHFYLATTPLYGMSDEKKKVFIPIWTEDDLKKHKLAGKHVTRYKGLGELSPWQLEVCLLNEKTRKLEKITYSKDLKKLIKLFSDSESRRGLVDGN